MTPGHCLLVQCCMLDSRRVFLLPSLTSSFSLIHAVFRSKNIRTCFVDFFPPLLHFKGRQLHYKKKVGTSPLQLDISIRPGESFRLYQRIWCLCVRCCIALATSSTTEKHELVFLKNSREETNTKTKTRALGFQIISGEGRRKSA